MIKIKKLSSSIDTIYNKKNEEKLWDIYLSILPIMSLKGKSKSFDVWKEDMTIRTTDYIEAASKIEEARNILKNFKPE